MAYDFQVVIDCANPHDLADWWADAMGWNVEPQNPSFIDEMISKGFATEEDTAEHRGSKVWKDGAAIRHPDQPDGAAPRRILFQLVPEPKSTKNRLHLDLWVGAENVESERSRLESKGARFLHTGQQGPHTWVTMADPEGNEFCLS